MLGEPPRATRWYRRALRLLPERVRSRYGADMAAMFDDAWRAASAGGRVRLILRSAWDLLVHAVASRRDAFTIDRRPVAGLADWVRDIRHALRSLGRQPTFAIVAIVTIALGTAATTSVLSVRNGLLRRPLPVDDIESLYLIDEDRGGRVSQPFGVDAIPYERFLAYREALEEEFIELAADRYRVPGGFSVTTDEGAISAHGYLVSGNYFDVLGVRPAAGGFFADDGTASVVLGHDFWRAHFGARDVIGSSMQIDSRAYTVVGVAPPGFQGTLRGLATDLWIPAEAYVDGDSSRFDTWFTFFGRVRPGVSAERAAAAVERVGLSIPAEDTTVRGVVMSPLTGLPPQWEEPLDAVLTFLLATGLAVLLIAAANIVGMLLARGIARRREIAIRLAIGAGRPRLVWQCLTEALVLFVLGGAAGAWLGSIGARWLQTMRFPLGFELALDFTPDVRVLALGLLITALLGGLFGLVPSLQATRGHLLPGLKHLARGISGDARGWRVFVTGQLALSTLLLVTAGLLARSWQKASALELGFDVDGVVVAQIDLGAHGYDDVRGRAFYAELVERVRALPGTWSASLANTVLLGSSYGSYRSDMRPQGAGASPDLRVNSSWATVEPEFFRTMGIELVAGRSFTSADGPGAPAAAIVSEVLAERLWPGENPLGRTFSGAGLLEVVGVARNSKYRYVGEPPSPFVFRSFAQTYEPMMTLHLRSHMPEARALREIRRIVRDLDPRVALQGEESLAAIVGLTLFPQRFGAGLMGLFAGVGLLFAGIGVYGILHFYVAQRTREAGIRLALGAHPRRLSWELSSHGLKLTLVALGVGLAAALPVARLLRSFMIGVSPYDPGTFVAAALLIVSVAALASALPARKATRADPLEALRAE
jgi:predicted permease